MKLSIKDLEIRYRKHQVIRGVNLSISEGSFFTILGKSGSGKSTILKAIAGLLEPLRGQIIMDETVITDQIPELRKIGFVFQKPHLFPHLTVAENIAFAPDIHGWSKAQTTSRVEELMSLVQITGLEDRLPSQISGGQQQRAAIARALAMKHSVLLMDEPFSSLDPYLREEMGQLVKSIQKELNLTVIFVTHDVEEAMALSDRICYLSEGRLLQCGSPNELYNQPINKDVAEFMGDVNWIPAKPAQTLFPQAPLSTEKEASLLLRPQDLEIDPQGSGFTVLSSERHGSLTQTILDADGRQLKVKSLDAKKYQKKDTVGVLVRNTNWHYI